MAETAELSLAEELGQHIDEAETTEVLAAPEAEKSEDTPEPQPGDKVEKPTAKHVKAVEKPTEAAEKPEASEDKPEDAQEATTEAKSLAPPATWSAAAKSIYKDLPETARKEIAKREQDYARGIQQHAEDAKGYQSMMREFQPYEAMIRAENGTPEGAIRDLLKTSYMLRTGTPQERGNLVMQIAQQFGADMTQFQGQQETEGQQEFMPQMQQYVQQLVSPHLQRIQAFEQSQLTSQQAQQQQMQQDTLGQIEAFQNATAEDGSPKHVYFENVREMMSGYFASGQAKSLEQAYDMACWATPEVRAALQADLQRSAEAKRLAEAKQKTTQARSSGFDVSGQGDAGISGANETSLRDELSSQLDAASGGGRL